MRYRQWLFLPALLLLATPASGDSSGTVNHAALDRVLLKKEWKAAQPDGCKSTDGRWCELHQDGSITMRNVNRLKRGLDELAMKRRKSADYVLTNSDAAAEAVLLATTEADEKYSLKERKRRQEFAAGQKKKKTKAKPPAEKVPKTYRCRKEEKCPTGMKKCFPDEKVPPLTPAVGQLSSTDACRSYHADAPVHLMN